MKITRCIYFVTAVVLCLLSSCKTNDATNEAEKNTVLVQMYNKDAYPMLEAQFSEYALTKQKVVSRPMHIVLFQYKKEKIADTTLIKKLKNSSLVKEAQLNREVQIRKN